MGEISKIKMKKTNRTILIISIVLGIFGLFALAAWFRSYITHQQYLDNLYFLLAGTIKEIWKFVSTPTVFITVVVLFIVFIYREKILVALSHLRKVEVGSTKAEFEGLEKALEQSIEQKKSIDTPIETEKTQDNNLRNRIIDNLEKGWIIFYLKYDGISIILEDAIYEGAFDDLIIGQLRQRVTKYSKDDEAYFLPIIITWITLNFCLKDVLFTYSSGVNKSITMNLLPGIRELLKHRLDQLDLLETLKEGEHSRKEKGISSAYQGE